MKFDIGTILIWHIYRRELCEDCAKEYIELLKALGADNICR